MEPCLDLKGGQLALFVLAVAQVAQYRRRQRHCLHQTDTNLQVQDAAAADTRARGRHPRALAATTRVSRALIAVYFPPSPC